MSLLSWFDNRTLYACQCMLAVMFAVIFLWMNHAYPSVRGLRSIICAFLVGIPCTFLLLSRGHIPDFLSVIVADLLSSLCFVLLYDGIVRFLGGQPRIWLAASASVVSACLVYYATEVRPNLVIRIAAMGLLAALMRGLTGWELVRGPAARRSQTKSQDKSRSGRPAAAGVTRIFGVVLLTLAGLGVLRVVTVVFSGATGVAAKGHSVQTSTMLLSVAYIGVYGLCFLTMAGHELILRSQEESEKDLLSGALNRRGIEWRLSVELKRCNRSNQRLSVALVDIDDFKSINDKHGHSRGDTAIREVSEAIARSLRDPDYLGRYGGDEFLIVFPLTACNHAAVAAERLNRAVKELHFFGTDRGLTLSIGLTEASPEDDAISLIARADEALYLAKKAGRDCQRTVMPRSTYSETQAVQQTRATAQT
jgi:diguanylate cyclase (GGDEF)-like protein